MFLPVPSMVDMLTIAMVRLLPAMDMDMLLPELPMVAMLSAIDMPSSIPIWIGLHQNVLSWICFS